MEVHVPALSPCLWFRDEATEAADLYARVIPGARVVSRADFPDVVAGRGGKPMLVEMEIGGSRLQLLNGARERLFTMGVSLVVMVDTQEELDRVWDGLVADGGREGVCGWLTDRFGVSWQVVPSVMDRLAAEGGERYARAMQALMGMTRLDVAALLAAADRP